MNEFKTGDLLKVEIFCPLQFYKTKFHKENKWLLAGKYAHDVYTNLNIGSSIWIILEVFESDYYNNEKYQMFDILNNYYVYTDLPVHYIALSVQKI